MKYSTNYNLKKPELIDNVKIEDINENTETIDQKLKENADNLESHRADYTNPHKVTASQVGASILGSSNTDINKVKALELKIDTRNVALAYTNGNLTSVTEKDGTTAVKVTSLTYDGSDNLTQVQEVAGGSTITTTLTYTTGTLTGVSKVVS